jgi:hypothetical protein
LTLNSWHYTLRFSHGTKTTNMRARRRGQGGPFGRHNACEL